MKPSPKQESIGYFTYALLLTTSSACSRRMHQMYRENLHNHWRKRILNVEEIGPRYRARIDTGARTTSIHAINVKIADESKRSKHRQKR